MPFQVRPVRTPEDFAPIAELISSLEPEPATAEQLAESYANRPAGDPFLTFVAEDDAGKIVGFGQGLHFNWHAPGKFYVWVLVDRGVRRQGLGSVLVTRVESWAREQGATLLEGTVRDNAPDSEAYGERRGYRRDRHIFESTLDLAAFDETRFAGAVERVRQGGIRFFTLADEAGEETERKLYEFMCRTVPDIPGWDNPVDEPYAHWRKWVLESQYTRRDGIIIAADGERFAGATIVQAEAEGGGMYTCSTSVDPDYRGRGVALALKLLSVAVARHHGAPLMRTNNDSLNGPMLAVNRKLGYRPEPGFYRMRRELPE
jgi:GNAT superfamily N-acetyltransferase